MPFISKWQEGYVKLSEEPVISKTLKRFRKDFNLNQADLAKILDISPRQYSRYEAGDVPLSSDKIQTLIHKFRVNPVWLLTESGEMYLDFSEEGLRLEYIRKWLEYEEEQFANELGIDPEAYEYYKLGYTVLPNASLVALKDLGFNPRWYLYREGDILFDSHQDSTETIGVLNQQDFLDNPGKYLNKYLQIVKTDQQILEILKSITKIIEKRLYPQDGY